MNRVDVNCRICGFDENIRLEHDSLLFPNNSYNQDLHEYDNFLCGGCGVVFQHPEITDAALVKYYNSEYRASDYAVKIDGQTFEPPIEIPWSGVSFKRFETFQRMMSELEDLKLIDTPKKEDVLIDFGGYQGLFAHAARNHFDIEPIVYDYNENGVNFARTALNMPRSQIAKNIYTDIFPLKANYCTMVHVFEHLRDPNLFLSHLRDTILHPSGYLYLEVPNIFGSPLSDPTHFFTYSMESLAYTLRKNGFEPILMQEHQDPKISRPTWSDQRLNISVIAQLVPKSTTIEAPLAKLNIDHLAAEIKLAHSRCRDRIVYRQIRALLQEMARTIYYIAFGLILERISFRLASNLKSLLRRFLK